MLLLLKLFAFGEALQPEYKVYQQQVQKCSCFSKRIYQ